VGTAHHESLFQVGEYFGGPLVFGPDWLKWVKTFPKFPALHVFSKKL
jgi:hypothetical protein